MHPARYDVGLVDLRRPENNHWDPSTCCPPDQLGIGPAWQLKGLLPKRQRSSLRRSYSIAGRKPDENRLLRLYDNFYFYFFCYSAKFPSILSREVLVLNICERADCR